MVLHAATSLEHLFGGPSCAPRRASTCFSNQLSLWTSSLTPSLARWPHPKQVGHIGFFSATYRLFKLPELERDCEDYGEAVVYKGTMASSPQSFTLDNHHTMDTGRVFPVCRNTLHMLMGTRFARYFDKVGDGKTHYGIYPDCGKPIPFASAGAASGGGAAAGAKPAAAASTGGGCC